MPLNIALIFAKANLRRGTRIKHFMTPPHGLQIVSALTPPEHTVRIVDEYHRPADLNMEADLIGISVWTAASSRAYALADHYRSRGIRVVLGGPHVSIFPQEALSHADAVVVGEAESVWSQVLKDTEAHQLRRIYPGVSLSMDETPIPDWSVIRSNDYVLRLSLSTTRGCARRCDFCFESGRAKPNFRQRSLARVLEEIDSRPSPVIAFLDNDFMVNRPFAKELLLELIQRKRRWLGMSSIEIGNDEEMLDLAAASGCRSLFVGFESIDPESLAEVHKGCNRVEEYVRNVRRLHDRGIMVNGSFVFGFDHDDLGVFDRTVQFGIDAKLETATFTVLTPYPGTTLYKRLDSEGRIFDRDWSHYDTTRSVFTPAQMTCEQLEAGYFGAYKKFYAWSSILERCRASDSGFAQRLFLNVAYKRVEPVYRILGRFPIGWLRPIFEWYTSPPRFLQSVQGEQRSDTKHPDRTVQTATTGR